jgi:hypothetical protein
MRALAQEIKVEVGKTIGTSSQSLGRTNRRGWAKLRHAASSERMCSKLALCCGEMSDPRRVRRIPSGLQAHLVADAGR